MGMEFWIGILAGWFIGGRLVSTLLGLGAVAVGSALSTGKSGRARAYYAGSRSGYNYYNYR